MKPLSVEMACLLGIHNQIKAVCAASIQLWIILIAKVKIRL